MKETFFISFPTQTRLGIYLPSQTITRKVFSIFFDDVFCEYVGHIRVQGVTIYVTSSSSNKDFDVDMYVTNKLNNRIST